MLKRIIKTVVEEFLYDDDNNLIKETRVERTETEYLNKNNPVGVVIAAAQPPQEEEYLNKTSEANLIKPKKVIPPIIKKAVPENLNKIQAEPEQNLIKTEPALDITEACENLIKTQELIKGENLNKKPESFLNRLNAARAQQNLIKGENLNKATEPAPVEVSTIPAAPAAAIAALNKVVSADDVSAVEYEIFDLASI